MSHDTPQTETPEIPPADLTVCFHGSEIYGATTPEGERVLAVRIKGHRITPGSATNEIETFEIVMSTEEATGLMVNLLAGWESIEGPIVPPAEFWEMN